MKKAFSALEILILIVVICSCFFIFKNSNPISSVVNEHNELYIKRGKIESQLNKLQESKDLYDKNIRESMENY